jgi:hypothetical protein
LAGEPSFYTFEAINYTIDVYRQRIRVYHAVPAFRCHCPARHFRDAQAALEYARQAVYTFRVAYAVWRVRKGTMRILRRFLSAQVQVWAWRVGKRTLRLLKRYPPAHIQVGA